ncbi:hypothetical protein D3C87_273720 [compost metagenome]
MYEIEATAFDELTQLLSEIADYKKKLQANMLQRSFLVKSMLTTTIRNYQQYSDKQTEIDNINRLERQIADKKSEINTDLIPLLEEIGNQGRQKLALSLVKTLDDLQFVIDSKPRS